MSYVSFDGLVERFADQIYGGIKGRLRQALVTELYARHLAADMNRSLRVLDAGGGLGQMSAWLLEGGHQVDYFDVSAEMVEHTARVLSDCIETGALSVRHDSVLSFAPEQNYDLVVVHALLEWLDEPAVALQRVMNWVRPGGVLGVLVYNRHMLAMRNLMRGTLAKVRDDQLGGDGRGLTPISPLDPSAVRTQLEVGGYSVISQAGIRTFSDLTEPTVLSWYDEDEVLAMERQLCEQAPYRDLGRYVLLLARRLTSGSHPIQRSGISA